ncbi:MAG: signal recognition particle-docking protein FtsY [Oscillospiraceae bacterium]|nr:signal recognition particle-docking protein FtsY [Oscillospiraceae bacterium]
MGFFEKIKAGLKKTKDSLMGNIERVLNSFTKIDEEFFEELEETLIMSDLGAETSMAVCDELRKLVKEQGLTSPDDIKKALKSILVEMLGEDKKLDLSTKPSVILIIGVNGAGKTTTIGKLSANLKGQGKKVLVAAADTFRAAAVEQLEVWTQRAGVDIVKHEEGSDPASVVFDAVTAVKARDMDVLICDTAGRLHNKKNLMEELRKISRIIHQQAEGCSLETLLVLDATTGQNAVNQAKLFSEVADITGIVLTKLDGTAKGGIIVSIHKELGIPVKLVGVGEKLDDLQEFSAEAFVGALFDEETDFDYNYHRLDDSEEDANEEVPEDSQPEQEEAAVEASETVDEIPKENAPEEIEDTEIPSMEEDDVMVVPEDSGDENDGEDTEASGENSSAEISENNGKKSLKDGKFGFLFKEITFGKKKKDGE